MIAEAEIRKIVCHWMTEKLKDRKVNIFMKPIVFHGKGSLSNYVRRNIDLSPFAVGDKAIFDEAQIWDVEPDVASIIKKNGKALVILAECKSTGSLSVENLAQILLYSVVTRAHAAGIFFTGNLSKPVENLIQNNIITYKGFNETKASVDSLIGLYSVETDGRVKRVYPKYEVFDV
jgi:hypothetical protein